MRSRLLHFLNGGQFVGRAGSSDPSQSTTFGSRVVAVVFSISPANSLSVEHWVCSAEAMLSAHEESFSSAESSLGLSESACVGLRGMMRAEQHHDK